MFRLQLHFCGKPSDVGEFAHIAWIIHRCDLRDDLGRQIELDHHFDFVRMPAYSGVTTNDLLTTQIEEDPNKMESDKSRPPQRKQRSSRSTHSKRTDTVRRCWLLPPSGRGVPYGLQPLHARVHRDTGQYLQRNAVNLSLVDLIPGILDYADAADVACDQRGREP